MCKFVLMQLCSICFYLRISLLADELHNFVNTLFTREILLSLNTQ